MRRTLFAFLLIVARFGAYADSLRFTESLAEKLACVNFEGDVFCEVATTDGATISATVFIPGLANAVFDGDTQLSLTVGGFEFFDVVADADVMRGTSSATFWQTYYDDATGRDLKVGELTFTRNGDTLTVSGSSKALTGSIVADRYTGQTGAFQGDEAITIMVGDFSVDRTVYFKGSNTVKTQNASDGETYELNNIQVTGEFDFTKPTVSVTSPKTGARLLVPTIMVQGKATDNIGVDAVLVAVGNQEFMPAELSNGNWELPLTLAPGNNILRVKGVDLAGNESSVVSVTVVQVVTSPLVLDVNGQGQVTGATNSQPLEIGKSYRLMAAPAVGWLFLGWSGDINSTNTGLSFIMRSNFMVRAVFVPNPFIPTKGTYRGLFLVADQPEHGSSGFIAVTTTDKGFFTGNLLMGAAKFPMNGQWDLEGLARKTVARPGSTPLAIELRLDVSNQTDQITGMVTDGSWVAELQAARTPFNARTNPAPQAGKYTVIIPGSDEASRLPGGDGYGTVSVDAAGLLKFAGALGDGTVINQNLSLAKDGRWPFYLGLYGGRGSIFGWLTVTKVAAGFQGMVYWFKPAAPQDKIYPAGFTNLHTAVWGSPYVTPPTGARLFNWANGVALLGGGNLASASVLSNQVMLETDNKLTVVNPGATRLTLTIALPTGLLTGSFVHPQTGKAAAIKGAALTSLNGVGGHFLGVNQSGFVFIGQKPPGP